MSLISAAAMIPCNTSCPPTLICPVLAAASLFIYILLSFIYPPTLSILLISALDNFIPSFLSKAWNDLLSSATLVSNPTFWPSVSANLIVFLTLLSPAAFSIASASAIFAFVSAVLGPLLVYLLVISSSSNP